MLTGEVSSYCCLRLTYNKNQTTVTAYSGSKQLLMFGLAQENRFNASEIPGKHPPDLESPRYKLLLGQPSLTNTMIIFWSFTMYTSTIMVKKRRAVFHPIHGLSMVL